MCNHVGNTGKGEQPKQTDNNWMVVIYLLMLVIHSVSSLLDVQIILLERSPDYVAEILLKVFI